METSNKELIEILRSHRVRLSFNEAKEYLDGNLSTGIAKELKFQENSDFELDMALIKQAIIFDIFEEYNEDKFNYSIEVIVTKTPK